MAQDEGILGGLQNEQLPDANESFLEQFPQGVPANVAEACELVMETANKVLRQCGLFSIDALRAENPTIAQIAFKMKMICGLMTEIAKDGCHEDQQFTQKAWDYAQHIHQIAVAITDGDDAELELQTAELKKRSFIL